MALDYTLRLTTDNSPEDIRQDISDHFSLDPVRENLKGTGVLISARSVDPIIRDYYEEEIGIIPTVSLLFTLDSNGSLTSETYFFM